jgi:hypothetical protein
MPAWLPAPLAASFRRMAAGWWSWLCCHAQQLCDHPLMLAAHFRHGIAGWLAILVGTPGCLRCGGVDCVGVTARGWRCSSHACRLNSFWGSQRCMLAQCFRGVRLCSCRSHNSGVPPNWLLPCTLDIVQYACLLWALDGDFFVGANACCLCRSVSSGDQ